MARPAMAPGWRWAAVAGLVAALLTWYHPQPNDVLHWAVVRWGAPPAAPSCSASAAGAVRAYCTRRLLAVQAALRRGPGGQASAPPLLQAVPEVQQEDAFSWWTPTSSTEPWEATVMWRPGVVRATGYALPLASWRELCARGSHSEEAPVYDISVLEGGWSEGSGVHGARGGGGDGVVTRDLLSQFDVSGGDADASSGCMKPRERDWPLAAARAEGGSPVARTMPLSFAEFWERVGLQHANADAANQKTQREGPRRGADFFQYAFLKTSWDALPAHVRARLSPLQHESYRARAREKGARWDNDIWASAPGVATHMHYDLQGNLYSQVVGYKRFVLGSPGCAVGGGWPLYPSTHARYRNVQLPRAVWERMTGLALGRTGASRALHEEVLEARRGLGSTPNSSACALQVVVLGPGDVLYIPPFWIHAGLALTHTLSHSSCFVSPAEQVVARLERRRLPFETEWPVAKKLAALRSYAGWARRALSPSAQPMWETLMDRYTMLYGAPGPSCSVCGVCYDRASGVLSAAESKNIEDNAVGRVGTTSFEELWARVPPAVSVVVAHNYVEEVASFLLGPAMMDCFVVHCLLGGAND